MLNEGMGLEAALFRSIFCSVMDIIGANQAAERGLFAFCYGEDAAAYAQEMYEEASALLLRDALSWQGIFDSQPLPADLAGTLMRRLTAGVLAVVAILFSVAAVKTLPEERRQMALPRYRALGGSPWAFPASKLIIALVLFLAVIVPIQAAFFRESGGTFLLTALIILAGAFGMVLAMGAWLDGKAVRYGGNLFLLISLVLGGSLWPVNQLPPGLAVLSRLTLPYYAGLGLSLAAGGAEAAEITGAMLPALLLGALGGGLAAVGLLRGDTGAGGRFLSRKKREHAYVPEGEKEGRERADCLKTEQNHQKPQRQSSFAGRLIGLSLLKGKGMVRGTGGLLALLAAAFLCGTAVASVENGMVSTLRLTVCDQDGSALSGELLARLSELPGISVTEAVEETGRQSLLRGETEGLLVIGAGYEEALKRGGEACLFYESAEAALSARGAREIVAGQAIAQRSRLRAVDAAQNRLGRGLSGAETVALMDEITAAELSLPVLYRIETGSGRALAEPFVPGRMSLAAFAVLQILFTAAPWSRSADGRQAEKRMYSLPRGRLLAFASDVMALWGIGVLAGGTILACGGGSGGQAWCALAAYAFCAAAFSLALVRFTAAEGRVDGLGPFIALLLCLAGGCFLDLSQVSPAFLRFAWPAPPYLALQAAQGSRQAVGVLLLEGVLFAVVGRPRR